jgi:hypothetical protein
MLTKERVVHTKNHADRRPVVRVKNTKFVADAIAKATALLAMEI